jgi:glycosyltransferase involved in cell wall biosynthesis
MVPKKGHDVLVRALGLLHDRGVEVEAVIAGEPDVEDAPVRTLIDELGLAGHVRVVGTLSQAEILAAYRRADVFALACRITPDGDRDGIPNVMVEAMAAGLPVVSTAVSGIPELVVDGHNGLLVPPDDAEALADALARISKDPELVATLAANARATVAERFDGDVLAQRMATLLGVAGAP